MQNNSLFVVSVLDHTGHVVFRRLNVPAVELVGVMHELGRDYPQGLVSSSLQRRPAGVVCNQINLIGQAGAFLCGILT